MRRIIVIAAGLAMLNSAGATAQGRTCNARVLQNVAALQNSQSIMRKGTVWADVTQFWRNTRTGKTWYCAHGDYCYPATVVRGGKKVPAIKLINCAIRREVDRDGDEVLYGVW